MPPTVEVECVGMTKKTTPTPANSDTSGKPLPKTKTRVLFFADPRGNTLQVTMTLTKAQPRLAKVICISDEKPKSKG